jgi:transcriptional pleiotropic repressor
MIESSVYIVGKNGNLLGKGEIITTRGGVFSEEEFANGQFSENTLQWLFGFTHTEVNLVTKGSGFYCILAPVFGNGERMGTVVYARENASYTPAETILAEYGASVAGMQILRNANDRMENEARKKTVVQLALEVLSYSELEAVKYIFNEIEGSEGFLVASKLAEEYKLTRSVIVNALRKLESAGVIDARSLGMKGTYIKVLNDYLYEQLAHI